MTEDDCKKFLSSEVIYTLHETEPGCFEFSSTVSLLPAWNMKNSIKVRPIRRIHTRAENEPSRSLKFHNHAADCPLDLLLVAIGY